MEQARRYPWVVGICLMRNYGQHNALLCGIQSADCEMIITIDDDLQHPPEEIPAMVAALGENVDVVYGRPIQQQHGLWRDLASQITKIALKNTLPSAINWVFAGAFYIIWQHKPLPGLLLTAYVGTYLVMASSTTLTWLHFSQVLPIVALISAAWVGELKNKPLQSGLFGFVAVVSIFTYVYVSWGGETLNPYAASLSAPLKPNGGCQSKDMVFCPAPPNQADWKISNIIATIISDPGCQPGACRALVIHPSGFEFSPASFGYYAITEAPNSPLEIADIGGATFRMDAFNFEALLNSEYIIYLSVKNPPDSYKGAAVKFLQSPPASFTNSHSQIAVFTLSNGLKAHLLKRTALLSLREAQDSIEGLHLNQKYKFGQFRVLAPLYASDGQYQLALNAYLQALRYEPDDIGLHFGLAQTYESLGQIGDASQTYQKIVQMAPKSAIGVVAQAWLDTYLK